jgi:glyoxylase-like metal-dependent hydrolase (beta-lactamase superfamily II)
LSRVRGAEMGRPRTGFRSVPGFVPADAAEADARSPYDRGMADSRLEQVAERTWWFTPDERSDRPSLVAVLGERATAVVDAGASPAHANAFLDALAPLAPAPLCAVALTHWHWDHSFGAGAYGAPIVAQRATAAEVAHQASLPWDGESLAARVRDGAELEFCAEMLHVEYPGLAGIEIALPDDVFDDALTLELGGVTCRLVHVGGDHAADSVVAHVPEDEVLVLGDCHYPRLYAPREHYTAAGLRALLGRLRTVTPVRHAIEGHGGEVLDEAAFAGQLAGLESAIDRIERLGEAALETAESDFDRETLELLLAGRDQGPVSTREG